MLHTIPDARDMPPDAPGRESHWPKRLKPLEPDRAYTIRELCVQGRWLRPTELAYWQVLGWSPVRQDLPRNVKFGIARLGLRSLLKEPELFRLSPVDAAFGNLRVVRLYAIGQANWSSSGYNYLSGRLGVGHAQDWYLASLLDRLRARLTTATAIELVRAEQAKKVNEQRAAYENLRKRWSVYRNDTSFDLPAVIRHFYRDVMLKLAHQQRGHGISADRSYKQLAQAAGLSFEYVRRSVKRGAQLIRGDIR